MATLEVRDESVTGTVDRRFTLEFPSERITVRELIRERVYQEVDDYNRERSTTWAGLVSPTQTEESLNGPRKEMRRQRIDWRKQFDVACDAFEKRRVLVLVDDTQAGSLHDMIEIKRGTEVAFLRLMPLVGG